MKAILWNIRSVKSQKAFQRFQMLHKYNKFAFIALIEPFQHIRTINRYRNRIQMPSVYYNCNEKIWCFVNHDFDVVVIVDREQQLSFQFKDLDSGRDFLESLVYAKCDRSKRLHLWDSL